MQARRTSCSATWLRSTISIRPCSASAPPLRLQLPVDSVLPRALEALVNTALSVEARSSVALQLLLHRLVDLARPRRWVVVHRALAPQLPGVDSGRSPNLAAAEVSVLLLHQRQEALVDSVLRRRHLEPSAAPSVPLGASYSIDKSNQ